jgi:hypothetical protein
VPSPDTPASAKVREQLIRALELDLVGPTPWLLAQLEAEGQADEVAELRNEVLDRPQPLVPEWLPDPERNQPGRQCWCRISGAAGASTENALGGRDYG